MFYLPLLPWIGGLVGAIPWIALCIVQALFPGLFGLAAVVVRRLSGWPFWFAALWAAQEWLKSTCRSADSLGVSSDSVKRKAHCCRSRNSAGRRWCRSRGSDRIQLGGNGFRSREVVPSRRHYAQDRRQVLPGVCISVVLLATALVWPHVRQSGLGAGDDPAVTVAAVQGNVPRLGLEFNAQRRAVLDNHVRETIRLAEDVRAGRAPQPMVRHLAGELLGHRPAGQPGRRRPDRVAAAPAIKAPILVGGVVAAPGYSRDNPVSTNSVIVWNAVTGPADRHDKQIVQPFGEYLPWRSFFSHLSPYADRAGYFVPGTGTGVVSAAGVPIGVTTCWEVIFDRAARVGSQRRPVADGAVQQRHLRRGDERAAARVRQAARGRARPLRRGRGHHGDQRDHRADVCELAAPAFFEPAYLDPRCG